MSYVPQEQGKAPPSAPPPYSQYPTGTTPQPYGFAPQQPPPPQMHQPMPQGINVTVGPAPAQAPTVVIMGGCPTCRVGIMEDDFTCCGICCAIVFFPIGILCCLAMKQKRCTNCGATFN